MQNGNRPDSGWKTWWNVCLHWLFPEPPACCLCLAALPSGYTGICMECRSAMRPLRHPVCRRCGREVATQEVCGDCAQRGRPFVSARAYGRYEGLLQHALQQFKFRGDMRLSAWFADCLKQVWLEELAGNALDLCVPVPVHASRRRERGFNPAERLAKEMARKIRLPLCHALERTGQGASAVTMGREARAKGLRGVFRVSADGRAAVSGRTILLVDDVFTTGATAEACAHALLDAGAASVYVLVVAR